MPTISGIESGIARIRLSTILGIESGIVRIHLSTILGFESGIVRIRKFTIFGIGIPNSTNTCAHHSIKPTFPKSLFSQNFSIMEKSGLNWLSVTCSNESGILVVSCFWCGGFWLSTMWRSDDVACCVGASAIVDDFAQCDELTRSTDVCGVYRRLTNEGHLILGWGSLPTECIVFGYINFVNF